MASRMVAKSAYMAGVGEVGNRVESGTVSTSAAENLVVSFSCDDPCAAYQTLGCLLWLSCNASGIVGFALAAFACQLQIGDVMSCLLSRHRLASFLHLWLQ